MQPIPECTTCGAPTLDRWCDDCHERMERAYADAEAERLVDAPVAHNVTTDLF